MRTSLMITVLLAASASTALAVTPGPSAPTLVRPPPTRYQPPTATVDFSAVAPALQGATPDAAIGVHVSGFNIGLGGPTLMLSAAASSALYIRIFAINSTGTTAPAGTYQVRFNVTNVSAQSTIRLKGDDGTTVTCSLAARPGYMNLQSCDGSVVTSGTAIGIAADSLSGAPQLEVTSVQVFKVR
jgi:hypothetical protein